MGGCLWEWRRGMKYRPKDVLWAFWWERQKKNLQIAICTNTGHSMAFLGGKRDVDL